MSSLLCENDVFVRPTFIYSKLSVNEVILKAIFTSAMASYILTKKKQPACLKDNNFHSEN